ncbi:MAG: DUF4158 domain-containing protein, partial [Pseudomonadota bacterium]
SDTAYPRFKSRLSQPELERFYSVTDAERACCDSTTRSSTTRLGFALLLKTYQRLGYFVTSDQVPNAIAEHVASSIGEPYEQENLRQYDVSQARRKHLSAVRKFLEVKPFDDNCKALMRQTFAEAALTREDVIDIINIGIETLVRHRYELPAFDTLLREARAERIATNQAMHMQIHDALGDVGREAIDKLFVVGNDPRRVSPWNDVKQDTAKPTIDGMRELVDRYDDLTKLACHSHLLKTVPIVKVKQWALEGNSLDAASMVDMAAAKRYTVALALIRQRLAVVTDDLCNIFCKQMKRALHSAEEALEKYLKDNQEKTDEILRRFSTLETLLKSTQSASEQLKGVRQTVTARPDLCEFSRLHAEYGGKNECRFVWQFFKTRRSEMLRILSKLTFVSTSQDVSFERSLAFMLENSQRQSEWLTFKG